MNDDRRVQRWTERFAWNLNLWIDTLEHRIDMLDLWRDDLLRRFGGGGNNDDGDGSARSLREQQERQFPPTVMSSSLSSQAEASSSRRHESGAFAGEEYEGCRSEVCRYCHAMERILLWDYSNFFINMVLIIALSMSIWIYDILGLAITRRISSVLFAYFAMQMTFVFIFVDTLAPAVECRRVCSKLHWTWKSLRRLRNKQRGLYCILLCVVAFGLYLLGHINLSSPCWYWSIIFGPLMLRLPQKLIEKTSGYFISRKEWQCDSEIDDEFLPLVTEASLQVLSRVGETGDHSPTPTSILSDGQNESFNDEDYIEGLYDIAPSMPSHEEGSTDGVELSELELSVGENDAEDDIKFQTGHFEKSSSSSSSEEGAFDRKIITVSSDESNDSDYEIIDKEEIENIKM